MEYIQVNSLDGNSIRVRALSAQHKRILISYLPYQDKYDLHEIIKIGIDATYEIRTIDDQINDENQEEITCTVTYISRFCYSKRIAIRDMQKIVNHAKNATLEIQHLDMLCDGVYGAEYVSIRKPPTKPISTLHHKNDHSNQQVFVSAISANELIAQKTADESSTQKLHHIETPRIIKATQ